LKLADNLDEIGQVGIGSVHKGQHVVGGQILPLRKIALECNP
jgi:hypothetical protein